MIRDILGSKRAFKKFRQTAELETAKQIAGTFIRLQKMHDWTLEGSASSATIEGTAHRVRAIDIAAQYEIT